MARLDSQIQALINYANETTGKADTQLGDAVKSLADGYKGGGGNLWELYNQDGLVFQLDCDNQCTADKWTDIIGGKEFVSNGNVTIDDNGVPTFSGSALYYGEVLQNDRKQNTIEVVFRNINTGQMTNVFTSQVAETLAFAFNSNNIYGCTTASSENVFARGSSIPDNELICAGVAYNDLVINGVTKGKSGSGYQAPQSEKKTVIGARLTNGNYALKGKIYAIRIYNRLLSEEEMLANQQIDIERFGNRESKSEDVNEARNSLLLTITNADALSSQLTALIAYANSITGKADATIGDAVKSLVEGYGGGGNTYEQFATRYGIPQENLVAAERYTILDGITNPNGGAFFCDVVHANVRRIKCKISDLKTTNAPYSLAGILGLNTANAIRLRYAANDLSVLGLRWGNSTEYEIPYPGTTCIIDATSSYFSVNEEKVSIEGVNPTNNSAVDIMSVASGGNGGYFTSNFKGWHFLLLDSDDKALALLIPIKRDDGYVGMLDLVSNKEYLTEIWHKQFSDSNSTIITLEDKIKDIGL